MNADLERQVFECVSKLHNFGAGERSRIEIRKIYDDDRQIYKLSVASANASYALKCRPFQPRKAEDRDPNASSKEYQHLVAVHKIISSAKTPLSMPVPIAVFDDHAAVLTTWCPGEEVRRVFYREAWRWPVGATNLLQKFSMCGEWLGRFHALSGKPMDIESVTDNRIRHLKRMIEQIPDSPANLLTDHQLARLTSTIERSLLGVTPSDFGTVHGNFTMRNIRVSSTTATPLDFEDSRNDCMYQDVGQFIADIILSSYRPLLRQSVRKAAGAEFLRSYRKGFKLDYDIIRAYVLYFLTATYYEILGRRKRGWAERILSNRQISVYSNILANPHQQVQIMFE